MSEEDLERRLTKIEDKVTSMVNSLNRVNQATADRIIDLEKTVSASVADLNRINQTTRDRITGLERSFTKLDKTATKLTKVTDKRTTERSIEEVVDRALKSFDKSRAKSRRRCRNCPTIPAPSSLGAAVTASRLRSSARSGPWPACGCRGQPGSRPRWSRFWIWPCPTQAHPPAVCRTMLSAWHLRPGPTPPDCASWNWVPGRASLRVCS